MIDDGRAVWLAGHILPHEPALRSHLARQRLPEGLDVDDVVQEAYARLAALPSLPDIRAPRAYLFQIARSIIIGHVRRSRIVSIRAVDDAELLAIAADEPGPDIQAADREQLRLLSAAIRAMPEPSRQAFLLRVLEELPYRSIGDQLGLSDNAVQKNVAKSLTYLMRILGRADLPSSEHLRDHDRQPMK